MKDEQTLLETHFYYYKTIVEGTITKEKAQEIIERDFYSEKGFVIKNKLQKKNKTRVIFYAKATSKASFLLAYRKFDSLINEANIDKALICDINESIPDDNRVVPFIKNGSSDFKKVLILGSHITSKSIEAGFFYLQKCNGRVYELSGNPFWKCLSYVYDYSFHTSDVNLLKQELQKRNIALGDILSYCECFSSSDSDIIEETKIYNVKYLKDQILAAKLIVLNGKGLGKMFDRLLAEAKITIDEDRIIKLNSTSSSTHGIPFESKGGKLGKRDEWKQAIDPKL